MLNGRLEIIQMDDKRGLIQGEIALEDSYEMTTLVMEAFGLFIFITPFDITQIKAQDGKLLIGFSVVVSMQLASALIDQIALRN